MKMTWKRKLMMRKRKLQFADVVLADQPSKKKINKNLMNHKIVVYVIVYTHVYIYIFFLFLEIKIRNLNMFQNHSALVRGTGNK